MWGDICTENHGHVHPDGMKIDSQVWWKTVGNSASNFLRKGQRKTAIQTNKITKVGFHCHFPQSKSDLKKKSRQKTQLRKVCVANEWCSAIKVGFIPMKHGEGCCPTIWSMTLKTWNYIFALPPEPLLQEGNAASASSICSKELARVCPILSSSYLPQAPYRH